MNLEPKSEGSPPDRTTVSISEGALSFRSDRSASKIDASGGEGMVKVATEVRRGESESSVVRPNACRISSAITGVRLDKALVSNIRIRVERSMS